MHPCFDLTYFLYLLQVVVIRCQAGEVKVSLIEPTEREREKEGEKERIKMITMIQK